MQFKFDVLAITSKTISIQYGNFAEELENLLSFPSDYRISPFQVLTSVQSDYHKLLSSNEKVIVPEKILKQIKNGNVTDIIGELVAMDNL